MVNGGAEEWLLENRGAFSYSRGLSNIRRLTTVKDRTSASPKKKHGFEAKKSTLVFISSLGKLIELLSSTPANL